MERPTKRPRFVPGPFQDDDPEADELNERPEEVNARRDPAVQLERSRAFAALKLKSAFERIFEKYEKDFTGVGDEIDLRTGEIIVNNGHIQSLKDAQLGGDSDEEGSGGNSGDEVSEAGSLNDEGRIVRGGPDNRLGRLGQTALPSIPPQIGLSPVFGGKWPRPEPLMGGSPILPTMMYPCQVQFGQFPMQYGTPIPPPTTDPTWSVPELPLHFVGNRLLSGESVVPVKKKAARLSLSAAREHGGDDEDDILLEGSATGPEQEKEKRKAEVLVAKQKLLLPRPPPGTITPRRRGRPPKGSQSAEKFTKIRKAGKSPVEKGKALQNRSTDKPDRGRLGGYSTKPNPGAKSQEEGIGTSTESARIDVPGSAGPKFGVGSSVVGDSASRESKPGDEPRQSSARDADSESLHEEDPDVFINFSDREGRLTRRPRNQTLRVEIVSKKLSDACSFRVLTPGPSEAGSPIPVRKVSERGGARPGAGRKPKRKSPAGEARPNEAPGLSGVRDACLPVPVGDTTPERRGRVQAPAVEVFSRNTVDPTYTFSDEDEPTVPRGKALRRKQNPTPRIADTRDSVLREISHNVDPRVVSQEQQLMTENLSDRTNDSSAARALSPTLSLHLEDTADHRASRGVSEQPGEGDIPRAVTETLEEAHREKIPTPDERVERRLKRRNSISEAEDAYSIRSSSTASARRRTRTETTKALPSTARQQKRLDKPQPRDTPTKTLDEAEVQGREIRYASSIMQEIAQTSPASHSADELVQTGGLSASDSKFLPSEERPRGPDEGQDPIPSPTLTSPTSKPEPISTIPAPASAPLPAPRTPVKTPQRRLPKSHKATKSTTATAATTTTKKKGVLSLLPPDDDEEDELSILTPIKPGVGASSIIRSTPARHHVRSGLLPVSRSASATKLKKAVVLGSANRKAATATPGATGFHTPSGRRKRKSILAVSDGRGEVPGTPSSKLGSELVETPGGTMRRCGEDGFRCGRDFCFSCL